MAIANSPNNIWSQPTSSRKPVFINHAQHRSLTEAISSCPSGRFVLVDGESGTGKSRSALQFCRHSIRDKRPPEEQPEGLHVYIITGSGDTPKSLALRIYATIRGTWPRQVTTTRAIESAVRALQEAAPPIVVVEEIDRLARFPASADALAEIITRSGLKFLLVGYETERQAPAKTLECSDRLRALCERRITFGYDKHDPALNELFEAFEQSLGVDKAGFFSVPEHVVLMHDLSQGCIRDMITLFCAMSNQANETDSEITPRLLRRAVENIGNMWREEMLACLDRWESTINA